jgi:ABC-type hemin transport system ATPase subunit
VSWITSIFIRNEFFLKHLYAYQASDVFFSCRVSLKAADGELIAIVGSVGAGKSSLLSAIVGEMEKIAGSVKVKVSNCGQCF